MKNTLFYKRWYITGYAFLYAIIVTILSLCLESSPIFLQMEYAIYDPMQRWTVVKESNQINELESLFCINLDNDFFDKETGRVRRDKLAKLMSHLASHAKPKAIFLDYLFVANYENYQLTSTDSLLIKKFKLLDDKLILPYEIEADTIGFNRIKDIQIKQKRTLLHTPKRKGYMAPFYLVGDETFRYLPLKVNDSTYSAIYAIVDATNNLYSNKIPQHIPPIFEIKYQLNSNTSKSFFDEVIHTYDASEFIQMGARQIKDLSGENEKIFFIGLFENRKGYVQ